MALHPAEKSVKATIAAARDKAAPGAASVADNSLRLPPGVQGAGTDVPAQPGVPSQAQGAQGGAP